MKGQLWRKGRGNIRNRQLSFPYISPSLSPSIKNDYIYIYMYIYTIFENQKCAQVHARTTAARREVARSICGKRMRA